MAIKISTGLRNNLLTWGSLKDVFAAGFINIYGGAVPASADDALGSATLLCTISIGGSGTGTNFDTTAASGVLQKAPGEAWSGLNVASGTATFYRHVAYTDTGASSTTNPRIQGTVSTAGADLNLSSVSLTSGATQTIDYYSVAMPSA